MHDTEKLAIMQTSEWHDLCVSERKGFLGVTSLRRCDPWTMLSSDVVSLKQWVPWKMRPVNNVALTDESRPWTAYRWWITIATSRNPNFAHQTQYMNRISFFEVLQLHQLFLLFIIFVTFTLSRQQWDTLYNTVTNLNDGGDTGDVILMKGSSLLMFLIC